MAPFHLGLSWQSRRSILLANPEFVLQGPVASRLLSARLGQSSFPNARCRLMRSYPASRINYRWLKLLVLVSCMLLSAGASNAICGERPIKVARRADPYLIASDGSGFTVVDGKRVYDDGKWLVLDHTKEWNQPASIIWEWDAVADADISPPHREWFKQARDAKWARGGTCVLVCAGGGGIAIVQRDPKKVLFYARVPGVRPTTATSVPGANVHSIEILPDGNLMAAASDTNTVTVISTDPRVSSFPDNVLMSTISLSSAHGVVWDKKRKVAWAIGQGCIAKCEYNGVVTDPKLEIKKSIPLPKDGGHDLFPTGDGKQLFVTTLDWTGTFDPTTGEFLENTVLIKAAKCVSQNLELDLIALTHAVPDLAIVHPEKSWWTPTVDLFTTAGMNNPKTKTGSHFYKVRWFLPNSFNE